jgi:pimeloyl-ACP methyl ester carboxylesterase
MEIDSSGVAIHVEVAGRGRPVVLLHGFPDSGAVWRHQVPALADAGFRVIVPDLRGYGTSGAPEGVEAYDILASAGDVVTVLDQLGVDRAHVVGHDFGAALAWTMGSFLPDRADHLAALSVGHPLAFRAAGIEQMEKSWYRANVGAEAWAGAPLGFPPVQAPTMGVWSSGDFALTERQMSGSGAFVSGPWRYERIEGPGHWLQLEAPDEVSRLLLDFLPV